MFREQYKKLNEQIVTSEKLIKKTVENLEAAKSKPENKMFFYNKTRAVVWSVVLCVCLTLPAAAVKSGGVYELLCTMAPGLARRLAPVQKSCVEKGIEMTVVSSCIHEDKAQVVIGLKDLQGSRVDDTTDLFDSYEINRPFSSSAYCEKIGYDKKTDTALFVVIIQDYGKKDITGDKVTFSLERFISGKKVYDGVRIPVDLRNVTQADKTQVVKNLSGCSGTSPEQLYDSGQKMLIPATPFNDFPVDGIDMVNMGYIDGKLHIQTMVKDNLDKDNHGYFYFKDDDGNLINELYSFNFVNHFEKRGRIDYHNYVFDIPKEEISNYSLFGYFVTSSNITEGPWQVTFTLENQ